MNKIGKSRYFNKTSNFRHEQNATGKCKESNRIQINQMRKYEGVNVEALKLTYEMGHYSPH